MMSGMLGAGFISAFALGPASFNIIRDLLREETWPWSAILGFLSADLLYITLAAALLTSPHLHSSGLVTSLTLLTVGALWLYSFKVFLTASPAGETATLGRPRSGFFQSLFLTLSNFHLILLYTGLFLNLSSQKADAHLTLGIICYVLGFIGGFLGLLSALKAFGNYLKNILRKVEIFAACGFLGLSIYLLSGIL